MPFFAADITISAETTYRTEFQDIRSAQEYCDSAALRDAEGIWNIPHTGMQVLIHRTSGSPESMEIVAIETDDASVTPGEIIGKLNPTHVKDRYKCILFTERDIMRLGAPKEFIATLSDSGYSISLEPTSRNFSINPIGLLPHVWRILRLDNNRANSKSRQKGFNKIYPGYDGNGSLPGIPRYL